ncbi:MFS transporter [Actinopolymorpha alba]|uniref:MFS transporter n=1 Tax=Actinopolymorpha alba TaxID=533267 RepID=UPI000361F0C5|nr:MFS transporter [Actinopolymorpha alba]
MLFESATVDRVSARDVLGVAGAAGGAFASFYCFYSAAPLIFAGAQPSPGVQVAVVMVVVVLIQPFVLLAGRWMRARARAAGAALAAMAMGLAALQSGIRWPGLVIVGLGFGVFVVTSTAWAKELATSAGIGRALGAYGFGSAIGGAIGAPVGLLLAAQIGAHGVVIVATAFAILGLVPVATIARKAAIRATTVPADVPPQQLPRIASSPRQRRGLVVPISLAAHLVAVTLYAAVLSSAGSLVETATATAAVLVAFATQAALALGRLASGVLCDRWSAVGTALVAGGLLALAIAGVIVTSTPGAVVAASAALGVAAGGIQTAALTLMMRSARTPAHTERASAAWNIAFDLGLGAGALTAGLITLA